MHLGETQIANHLRSYRGVRGCRIGLIQRSGTTHGEDIRTIRMEYASRKHLSLLVILMISTFASANDRTSTIKGSEYYLGFFQNAAAISNVSIMLTTSQTQPEPYFVEPSGIQCSNSCVNFTSNKEAIIDVPNDMIVKSEDEQNKGIHISIQSDTAVTVIGKNEYKQNGDTFLALPVTNMSSNKEKFVYYVMSVGESVLAFRSMVLIVGTQNNTEMDITPVDKIVELTASNGSNCGKTDGRIEYHCIIGRLQTVLITSRKDLTGTKIIADNEVSVISGHQAGGIIAESAREYDHLVEQIPPVKFWCKDHYVAPLATRNSYSIRILTAFNSTKVQIYCNGSSVNESLINEGQHMDKKFSYEYCAIYSNNSVLVAQFSHYENNGGPMMALVPATSQYLHRLDFSTIRKTAGSYDHYINIIVMEQFFQTELITLTEGERTLSLQSINNLEWTQFIVNDTHKASITRINVMEGPIHIFHANTSALITAIAYGFASRAAYGHPAGLKLFDLCYPNPCGSSGICLANGNSYECVCNNEETRNTPYVSLTTTASNPTVMPSTTFPSNTTNVSVPSTTSITQSPTLSPGCNATDLLKKTNCSSTALNLLRYLKRQVATEFDDLICRLPVVRKSRNCTTDQLTMPSAEDLMDAISVFNEVIRYMRAFEGKFFVESTKLQKLSAANDLLTHPTFDVEYIGSLALEENPEILSNDTVMVIVDSFSNVSDSRNNQEWKKLESKDPGRNQLLLKYVERFGILLAENLHRGLISTVSSDNLIIEAMSVTANISRDITFPNKASDSAYNTSNSIEIPANFISHRSSVTDLNPVPVVNIHYENIQNILSYGENLTARPISQVLSSQVTNTSSTYNQSIDDVIHLTFQYNLSVNDSSPVKCGYWNFSRSDWDTEGVTVVRNHTENSTIICSSTHLTSFAVLVDVSNTDQQISDTERRILSLVSLVGCAISIVCLLITVIILLCYRKTLLHTIHYFVHFNLAIALLLALLIFVGGIETATENEIACTVVAASLHYFFTAVFSWMMSEGIMLYFLLVKVFSTRLGERKLFYFLLGWGLPIPIVAVTAGVAHDQYGHDKFCWIENERGSIWSFVTPMLAIIIVNIMFLILTILSVMQSTRRKMTVKPKEASQLKIVKTSLKATVILLPLLGITWVFGLLAVNQESSVFAWIFAVSNSLQGVFIFLFHIVRNDQIWKKISSCLKQKEKTVSFMDSTQPGNNSCSHKSKGNTHSVNTLKAVINFESKGNASGISDFTEMEKGTTPETETKSGEKEIVTSSPIKATIINSYETDM